MRKLLLALPAVALTGSLLMTGCSSSPSTCAPMSEGPIGVQLQSYDLPLRGGGGGGGGGGHSSGGGGHSSSSGGRSSGGGTRTSGGSYGASKGGSSSSSGGSSARMPASKPSSGYHPAPGAPHYTYVRQSNGSWLPFLGGVIAGEALSQPPAGCR